MIASSTSAALAKGVPPARPHETVFAIPRFAACLGAPIGAVRASVGIPTVPADIERLLEVLESYRGERVGGAPPGTD